MEEQQTNKLYGDTDDFDPKQAVMKYEVFSLVDHNCMEDYAKFIDDLMQPLKMKLSKRQLYVALLSILMITRTATTKQQRKQFWTVPFAKGKTRIAIAIATTIKYKCSSIEKLFVVFPNETLKKQDEHAYQQLQTTVGNTFTIDLVVGLSSLNIERPMQTVIVCDEADYEIIDCNATVPRVKAFIAMSATNPQNSSGFVNRLLSK